MNNLGAKGIVQLALTYKCQCNCEHCGVKYFAKKIPNKMTLSFINKIFGDLKLSGFEHIDLSGGEPTLRNDIFDIIGLGKAHGLNIMLETNGLSLKRNSLKMMKKNGIGRICLSLDHYKDNRHDTVRKYKGAFDSALDLLKTCRDLDIRVHISAVPPDREYFINGGMNRQIKFCLKNGAEKVRILFPSYVGSCSLKNMVFCSERDEIKLLKYIDPEFYDSVYIESELSGLRSLINGKKVECPAKSIFCYIACNGLVMPCPYLPIVFGDVASESMIEIFHRIQDHPFMKNSGIYCPTRDKKYLNSVLDDVRKDKPFRLVESANKINLCSRCNNHCFGCNLESKNMAKETILDKINKIDKKYGTLDLFGGEIFIRNDIFDILDKTPTSFRLNIHTNGRIFSYAPMASKLQLYNINALKIPFFSFNTSRFEHTTRVPGSFEQTKNGIKNLANAKIPVCVYLPKSEIKRDLSPLISLGVTSISGYELADKEPLPGPVLCFGKNIKRTFLLWNKQ